MTTKKKKQTRIKTTVGDEDDELDEDMLPEKGTMKRALADKKIQKYFDSREKIEECLRCMYSYVWGQCTRGMQSIIEADKEYKAYSEEFHTIYGCSERLKV